MCLIKAKSIDELTNYMSLNYTVYKKASIYDSSTKRALNLKYLNTTLSWPKSSELYIRLKLCYYQLKKANLNVLIARYYTQQVPSAQFSKTWHLWIRLPSAWLTVSSWYPESHVKPSSSSL